MRHAEGESIIFRIVWLQYAFCCGRIDWWIEVQLSSTSFKKMKIIEIWPFKNGGRLVMTYMRLCTIPTQFVHTFIGFDAMVLGKIRFVSINLIGLTIAQTS